MHQTADNHHHEQVLTYMNHHPMTTRRDTIGSALKTAAILTGASSLKPQPSSAEILGSAVPTISLGNSPLKVSRTIQGYWQLAGGHGKYNKEDAIKNMEAHYNAGITTLDTADIYGPSEQIMGNFLKETPNAIVCTKFCCFRYLEEIDMKQVRTRVKDACQRLQVDKIPLIQFFWSDYNVKRYIDVALMLTSLKDEGLIGEIGATNFDLIRLKQLKDAGVPIVSNQVQLSCIDQRPVQSGMADWCADNGVGLIAFGTVASGILSDKYLGRGPPTQEEKNTASMRMYSKTVERFGDWKLFQELLETINDIAKDIRESGRCKDVTISNIAQRYILDTKSVAAVLVGVRNTNHIDDNIRTHSFRLTDGEIEAIRSIVAKRSGPKGDVWDIERGTVV
jgi:aryl-alcohol dehydrogenase-like predicted oxidoreductase